MRQLAAVHVSAVTVRATNMTAAGCSSEIEIGVVGVFFLRRSLEPSVRALAPAGRTPAQTRSPRMSRSELVRFCSEYLPDHPELKQRFDARDPDALAKGLARLGADAGYDFSELEVADAIAVEASAELSDNQLD